MTNYKKDVALATVMGAKIISDKSLNPLIKKWESKTFPLLDGRFLSTHELHFRSDWNWIMPVVFKFKVDISGMSDLNAIADLCYDVVVPVK